ncbi:helix-turn-helix transcriptional regulator [Humitalea sp. 24SJ18S-53]|uniref:helix-turn-helix transcriptional regulator n=1 Tax=Humitalea sp. 24SJ18S-53 TaxID=3422307 RepID=UPI003D6770F8
MTDPETLLDEDATARFLSLSPRSLQRMRVEGGGPVFTRLGERRVAYRHADLVAWVAARRFASTSAETAGKPAARGTA